MNDAQTDAPFKQDGKSIEVAHDLLVWLSANNRDVIAPREGDPKWWVSPAETDRGSEFDWFDGDTLEEAITFAMEDQIAEAEARKV